MTQILVIHVKGNEDRRQFIEGQLGPLGMSYTFILDGNKEELTEDVLNRYFKGNMHGRYPNTSCAYKHLLAYQEILHNNWDGALIVEDDLRFYSDFKQGFERSMQEYRDWHPNEPVIINYEESSLLLVPRSKRKKGQMLYPASRDRFAGCYYINSMAAKVIMDNVRRNQSEHTSDRLHSFLVEQGLLKYYWTHPTLACQCSCDGSMPTMIPTRPRPLKRVKWFYKKIYKHILYWFR